MGGSRGATAGCRGADAGLRVIRLPLCGSPVLVQESPVGQSVPAAGQDTRFNNAANRRREALWLAIQCLAELDSLDFPVEASACLQIAVLAVELQCQRASPGGVEAEGANAGLKRQPLQLK